MLEQLDDAQLAAVVHLLHVMTDPVACSLANASLEDEPIGADESDTVKKSKASLKDNKAIPHEEVLAIRPHL